ncbi:hypothetical protein D3C72_1861400 [compost metagenome]
MASLLTPSGVDRPTLKMPDAAEHSGFFAITSGVQYSASENWILPSHSMCSRYLPLAIWPSFRRSCTKSPRVCGVGISGITSPGLDTLRSVVRPRAKLRSCAATTMASTGLSTSISTSARPTKVLSAASGRNHSL